MTSKIISNFTAAAILISIALAVPVGVTQAASNLSGSIMSSKSSDRAAGRCSSDYMMCTSNIGRLCKRLVRRGMGGGSISNCTVRKDKRCSSRLTRCLDKI